MRSSWCLALVMLFFACGAVRHVDAQDTALNQRLAASSYVVRNGEASLRSGTAPVPTTSLAPNEELQLVKTAVAAAKTKTIVPDESAVAVIERADAYEVTIAKSAIGHTVQEIVKVTIDKRNPSLVQVAMTRMEADESVDRLARFRELATKLTTSEYVIQGGALARRPGGVRNRPAALDDATSQRVMENAVDAAKAKLTLSEGSGVVIIDGLEYYEVVIGKPPNAVTLGPDYTAKVMVDKNTFAVIRVLAGS